MNETTKSITEWGEDTFGEPRDLAVIIGRALLEVAELVTVISPEYAVPIDAIGRNIMKYDVLLVKDVAEEIADIRIVLEQLSGRLGVDGQEEVNKKMAINRARKWDVSPDGHGQHK